MLRCATNKFKVPSPNVLDFPENVSKQVSKILGKDVTGFQRLMLDKSGRVMLLTGNTAKGDKYSEFHFGAGESSVIRMISEIEFAEEQTLILIEEIENGLHPVATVRMVEYLIDVAERKKIQAIFTTHSNDALKPLPSKAIWVATQDRIFQGKLDIQSLRAVTGQIETKLAIFVEDSFAQIWMEAILRQTPGVAIDHIQVHGLEGDGIAVAVHEHHNKNPSIKFPSVCFIDGDSRQKESIDNRIFRFPGESPESYVFDEVLNDWHRIGGKLSVALLQKFENSDSVKKIREEVRRTNRDPHLLFAQVGERLGLIPESTVTAAFANIWAQSRDDVVRKILDPIFPLLPKENH